MAAKWANAIVTLTEEDKGYYEENLKIRCPIRCIYNPVIWKENTGEYDTTSKMILSAGRLTYQKGFDILVDVADKFLKKYPDWKWVVLGEGEDRQMLEEKVKMLDLDKQLLFPGNVSNIDKYYSEAAMFVMTSRFEGLPMTLLETKPYKLPLISFNCKTGPSELIKEGVNGFLVSEGNINDMADKIVQLMEDEKLRKQMSKNTVKEKKMKKKILFMLKMVDCGGVEQALLNLLDVIDKDKFECELILMKKKGEYLDRFEKRVKVSEICTQEYIKDYLIDETMPKISDGSNIKEKISYCTLYAIHQLNRITKKFFKKNIVYKYAFSKCNIAKENIDVAIDYMGYGSFTTYYISKLNKDILKYSWIHEQRMTEAFEWNKNRYKKFEKIYAVKYGKKMLNY